MARRLGGCTGVSAEKRGRLLDGAWVATARDREAWEVELATGITSSDCGELDLRSNFDRKEKRRLRRAQRFKKVDEAMRVLRVEGAAGLERLRLRWRTKEKARMEMGYGPDEIG